DDVVTSATPLADAPAVTFENVSFSYPSGEQAAPPVLDGVSFVVPRGSRTALVGPSGAGKSTVFALVERFYDPTDGRVLASGLDVREVSRTDLRTGIGYVEQDAPVLAGSLADNLRLGSPDATDEQMRAVLAQVNLADVATRSPAG